MSTILDNNILYDFKQITQFDLGLFFNRVNSFIINDYPALYDYFKGSSVNVDSNVLTRYKNITDDNKTLRVVIRTHAHNFKNVQYWELFDFVEDIDSKIKTINNLSKLLRSTKTNFSYTPTVSFNDTLGQNQTLEEMVLDQLGQQDENLTNNTAIKNDLMERDYSVSGGKVIQLNKLQIDIISQVTTIADNPDNVTILGLDLPVLMVFDTVLNDFVVLGYEDTLNQSIEILTQLQQGDLPLSPTVGVKKKLTVGSNVGVLHYRDLIEQLSGNFGTDDLFDGISVTDIHYDNGDLFVQFNISVKLNKPINKGLLVG